MKARTKVLKLFNRDDVSAFLLIAFLFQFFAPIVALRNSSDLDQDFIQLLRDSICQAPNADGKIPDRPVPLIPGVYCDLCVLHVATGQPAVVPDDVLAGLPIIPETRVEYDTTCPDDNSSQVRGNLSPSRAPPHVHRFI